MTEARRSYALLLLMALVPGLALIGCSDRKETVAKQLIGHWQCTAQTIIYHDGRETRRDPAVQVVFSQDGSYQGAQGQSTSRGTYTVIDAHHYTYQVTQSDHAEHIGLSGTAAFSVTADQLEVIVPGQGEEANAIKRIETTCQRQ
jgi:hypothetical protein